MTDESSDSPRPDFDGLIKPTSGSVRLVGVAVARRIDTTCGLDSTRCLRERSGTFHFHFGFAGGGKP